MSEQQVFIIGAAKSATSTLHFALKDHPNICFSRNKEPGFFALDSEYGKGLEYYQELFNTSADTRVFADGSTQYSRYTEFPHAAERIFQHYPDAKFVYVMRHPVERAFSQYVHRLTKEKMPGKPISLTFEEFVAVDTIPIDDSLYKDQVAEYLKYFPIERFLFLLTEDVKVDLKKEVDKICTFIDVPPFASLQDKVRKPQNTATQFKEHQLRGELKSNIWLFLASRLFPQRVRNWLYDHIVRKLPLAKKREALFTPVAMRKCTRKQLANVFSESNAWVEGVLKRDLSHWNE